MTQSCFNLAQFYTIATQFDLVVDTSLKINSAIRIDHRSVSGTIQTITR